MSAIRQSGAEMVADDQFERVSGNSLLFRDESPIWIYVNDQISK